jgi:hypothetical protein
MSRFIKRFPGFPIVELVVATFLLVAIVVALVASLLR